jgi:hypothetical protein
LLIAKPLPIQHRIISSNHRNMQGFANGLKEFMPKGMEVGTTGMATLPSHAITDDPPTRL